MVIKTNTKEKDIEKSFLLEVQNTLAKKERRGVVLNVGDPHPVFVKKGMPDQPIRISPAVIRKARKKTGYNDHCVKQEDLERIPKLLDNPVALLKSLTGPDKFVVVLDAKDEKGRPVVAAINTKDGLNTIDSVYGRENFADFVRRTNEAGGVLSVNKKKAIEGVWAYQQYQGETTIDDYQLSLSPQSEDLSRPNHQKNQIFGNQGARPLTRAKEQDMADEFDGATAQAGQGQTPQTTDWTGVSGNWGYDEEIAHTFGNQTVEFRFGEEYEQVGEELEHSPFYLLTVMEQKNGNPDFSTARELRCESVEAAREFVQSTIEHFEKALDVSIGNITGYISGLAAARELDRETAEQVEKTPEEQAFLNALHQRKVIADALKAGTLSCLPGADGYADTEAAVNIANGTRYHGASQLYLKEFQKQNGFPTAEYMTQDAIQKSGIPIRKGEHGVTISFQAKNEESGEWEQKNVRLFNVAQSAKPAELKAYAAQQVEEKAQEKIDFLKKQHGENYQPLERKERAPAPEVTCSSTEPEKYLGAYLAAVSMGSKFKVTPEQKAEFAQKMETSLFERGANGHTNPFKLSKICNAANDHCKEVIKQTRAVPKQEQVQEQNRGRGR